MRGQLCQVFFYSHSKLKEEEERVRLQIQGMGELLTVVGIALPNANFPLTILCCDLAAKKEDFRKW